jgi:hypothetical protein
MFHVKMHLQLLLNKICKRRIHTLEGLLEKAARNPLLLFVSDGIKHSLKALGRDSNRDLSIPNVRI